MILLPAGNPSSWTGPTGNNTYLLNGTVPTLIDAGVGNPDHITAIEQALDGRALALVLITHGHTDHVQGVPALEERWPQVEVRSFGSGRHPLVADERIAAGDGTVDVLHTPGHSPDHCCFVQGRELFCGDLVRVGGTVVIPATRGGDMAVYLESLRAVQARRPERLLPAHGPVINDPSALIAEYIGHRLARERQVLDALAGGASTPEEIAAHVYDRLPDDLRPAALETVLAHLYKLRSEGRAVEHGGRWTVET